MKVQKPESLTGYILLIIGLIILFIPIITATLILLGNMQMPIYVQKPTVTGTDPNAELARIMADAFPLLNIIPTFLLFVVLVYAGSVLIGKGIGLIKEINWKVVKATQKEVEETEPEETTEPAPKPAKRARRETPEE
jgi:hypothetical protein